MLVVLVDQHAMQPLVVQVEELLDMLMLQTLVRQEIHQQIPTIQKFRDMLVVIMTVLLMEATILVVAVVVPVVSVLMVTLLEILLIQVMVDLEYK